MRSLLVLATLVVAGLAGACTDSATVTTAPTSETTPAIDVREVRGTLSASSSRNFITQLSGEAEVQQPPVVTQATGVSKFQLSQDGTSMTFFVNVAQLENVRFAHLHLGAAGANGPVVVNLRLDKVTGPVNGRYAEGTITAASLVGPLAGQPLSALVSAIESARIYTNVHSDRFPGGELRGQVR
jgi:hypothetical protein